MSIPDLSGYDFSFLNPFPPPGQFAPTEGGFSIVRMPANRFGNSLTFSVQQFTETFYRVKNQSAMCTLTDNSTVSPVAIARWVFFYDEVESYKITLQVGHLRFDGVLYPVNNHRLVPPDMWWVRPSSGHYVIRGTMQNLSTQEFYRNLSGYGHPHYAPPALH